MSFELESNTFSVRIQSNCAVVTLKDGAFVLGTDLQEKELFLSTISRLEAASEVQGMVFFDPAEALGDDDHRAAIERARASRDVGGRGVRQHEILFRAENALNQFALRLTESTKLVAFCPQGALASPFFGLSLAADLRLAAPDLRLCFSHVEFGEPPNGTLAFLLPRFLGQGRAVHMLIEGGEIDAGRALELGLVSQVIADDDFQTACLRIVEALLASSAPMLPYSRPLFYPYGDELRAFFARESKLRLQAYNRMGR